MFTHHGGTEITEKTIAREAGALLLKARHGQVTIEWMGMVLSHDSTLSDRVIGMAIQVHRHLGPGLLESAYEQCLCHDPKELGIAYERQVPLPVVYKGMRLECGYRIDLVVERELIIEIKSVERIMAIHEAQMLTYLRLSGHKVGILMNFNSAILKDG